MSENNTAETHGDWDKLAKLEALLFVSSGLTDVSQLADALEISEEEI
jgi:hypothetical protein